MINRDLLSLSLSVSYNFSLYFSVMNDSLEKFLLYIFIDLVHCN